MSETQVVDLDKVEPGEVIELDKVTGKPVTRLRVSLKWKKKGEEKSGHPYDADVSAFVCDANGKVLNEDNANFVKGFPASAPKECPGGGVKHSGDDTSGELGGETLDIDASKFLPGTAWVDISATIFRAKAREQTFGKLGSVILEISDPETDKVIASGKLSFKNSVNTAVNAARIMFEDGQLYPTLLQEGYQGGLGGLARDHGVPIGTSRYDDGPAQD